MISKPKLKLKIGIDLDDTVCQTSLAIVDYIEEHHKDKINNFRDFLNRPEFKVSANADWLIVKEALNSERFFLNIKPYQNAIEAISNLNKKYLVYFCTSAGTYKYAASEKMAWITKYFGEEWLSRLIITRAKDIVDLDILIDDRIDNAKHFLTDPKWQQIVFNQTWNAKLNLPRISNWSEAESVIDATAKQLLGSGE